VCFLPKKEITVDELKKLLDEKRNDFVIIDVRTRLEYSLYHIPTALNIPLSSIDENNINWLDKYKGKKIIFVCSTTNRSRFAIGLLESFGVNTENMFYLNGGMSEWVEKDYPTVEEGLPEEYS